MSKTVAVRKYVSIDEIATEYLPISKKRLRVLVKEYLPYKQIGGRIFTERKALEDFLSDNSSVTIPMN